MKRSDNKYLISDNDVPYEIEIPVESQKNYASPAITCEIALRLLHQKVFKDSTLQDAVIVGSHIDNGYKYRHHRSFEDVCSNVERFDEQFQIIEERELSTVGGETSILLDSLVSLAEKMPVCAVFENKADDLLFLLNINSINDMALFIPNLEQTVKPKRNIATLKFYSSLSRIFQDIDRFISQSVEKLRATIFRLRVGALYKSFEMNGLRKKEELSAVSSNLSVKEDQLVNEAKDYRNWKNHNGITNQHELYDSGTTFDNTLSVRMLDNNIKPVKRVDGIILGKVADNITEIAFEIRSYSATIDNLLESNKKINISLKQQEDKNSELHRTIQDLKDQMEQASIQNEMQISKLKDQHLKEIQQLEINFGEREGQFEDEKQKLHKYIISLESRIREIELERSSITYTHRRGSTYNDKNSEIRYNESTSLDNTGSSKIPSSNKVPKDELRTNEQMSTTEDRYGTTDVNNKNKYFEKVQNHRKELQIQQETDKIKKAEEIEYRKYQDQVEEKENHIKLMDDARRSAREKSINRSLQPEKDINISSANNSYPFNSKWSNNDSKSVTLSQIEEIPRYKEEIRKTCPNCRKEKLKGEVFELSNCSHEICLECLEKYLNIWLKMPAPPQCPLGRRKIGNIHCISGIGVSDIEQTLKIKCRQCPRCNTWCKYEKGSPTNCMSCRCGLSFCYECNEENSWPCSIHTKN